MSASGLRSGNRRTPIIAYGCVGAAVAFIFALTLGVFDTNDKQHRMASNNAATVTSSTP